MNNVSELKPKPRNIVASFDHGGVRVEIEEMREGNDPAYFVRLGDVTEGPFPTLGKARKWSRQFIDESKVS
jgi:hypothetical protein